MSAGADVAATPAVSIVVPALDEGASLAELCAGIRARLEGRYTYEIIVVDDGSRDGSWSVLTKLREGDPRVRGVRLRRNFGKAAALAAGFRRSRGAVVVTMDADLQDDPADLPEFVSAIEAGADVVVGWKVARRDPLARRALSRIFNVTVGRATGLRLHDMNCGFKAFRPEVLRTLPLYADLFRFIAAFAASEGFRVVELPVKHHRRRYGASRYGNERILRGFFDLLSVTYLTRYQRKPMHLFGTIGLIFGGVGFAIESYLTVQWFEGRKIGDRPLLLLGVLLILAGIQFFSVGFLGEVLAYQSSRKAGADDPQAAEELG